MTTPLTTPVLEYQSPQAAPPRPVMYWYEKAYCALAGIVLPVGCFLAAADQYPAAAEYQSGAWHATISLMPAGPSAWPLYPLLAYAMICMGLLVARPVGSARHLVVRLGLYSGVVLALQFTCIQAIAFRKPQRPIDAIVPCGVGVGVAAGVLFAGWVIALIPWRRMRDAVVRVAGQATWVSATFLAALVCVTALVVNVGAAALIFVLITAPALTLAAYAGASMLALRIGGGHGSRVARWLLPLGWLGAYVGALRLSYANALAEYARLPTTAPGCFIATAAARGHQRFVGSVTLTDASGQPFRVNSQLRLLKCFELLLQTLSPRCHQGIRRIYDRVGPRVARGLTHPVAADVAYVLLKPIEWGAAAALWLAVPDWRRRVAAVYRSA